VEYQYDQLGRLISAATQGAGGWGLAWNHDGFGNLTQQSVTKGQMTGFTLSINGATNRVNYQNYDANGNWLGMWGQSQTYDVDNRVHTASSTQHQETYLYSARNERLVSKRDQDRHRVHFYGADGLLLGIYTLEITQQNPSYTYPVRLAEQERIYFGGRLMQIGGEWVATDRLGSVVRKGTTNYKYAPYGQEIGGATANDTVKFATYTRDSVSGLDYALNRYYKPEWGRFTSPDPYMHNPSQGDPQSWNLYSYTNGDPVNNADSTGLFTDPCAAVGCLMAPPEMSSPGTGGGGLVWLGGPLCVGNSWLPVPVCRVPVGSAPQAPPPNDQHLPVCCVQVRTRPIAFEGIESPVGEHSYIRVYMTRGEPLSAFLGEPDFVIEGNKKDGDLVFVMSVNGIAGNNKRTDPQRGGTFCAGPEFCRRLASFVSKGDEYNLSPEEYSLTSMTCHSMTYTALMSTMSGYGWNIAQFEPRSPSSGWGQFVWGMWY